MCLLWAHGAIAQNLGDPECETLWLVSSYSTNSIKAYDGCSGDYIQDIEDNGWLAGPQAIVDDGDGGLVVVSEENDRLIRFDRQTLAVDRVIAGDDPETGEVELSPFDAPTGLAISPDGRIFVGSFSQEKAARRSAPLSPTTRVLKALMRGCGCRATNCTYPGLIPAQS
jgi:streptogramin lyase